ncbi:glycosyltransferase family 4 protein [uncultured Maribacter sp.]|uniref:glycosyltransferase family 4 protein n=1 Tax=uncultured Maribacter sp. TaxID=431308 RepID=UPI002602A3C4|nr:glycosyltransferase family 4 protein [uncultured Maribacter sp.]
MKVLWITNSILPELAKALKIKHAPFEGWLIFLSNQLAINGIDLTIATTKKNVEPFFFKGKNIKYYLLNSKKKKGVYDKSLEPQWKDIINQVKPDIIHLQGSENSHALALINTHPNEKYLLSIQGLISVYARYYKAGLSNKDILKNLTLRFLLRGDSIFSEQKEFYKRGELIEKKYFRKINNFLGRTAWDKAHTKYLNRNSNYFHCGEILRPSFYTEEAWSFNNCEEYSIFLSQGNYPLKGFHQVLKAVALIKNDFPKIKIYFAGRDTLLLNKTFKKRIRQKNYSKYLSKLIKDLQLSDNVKYLGMLNESEMISAYKKANVFICPSSIENSPNSLAEAQILGVPCISSNVGGVSDMIEDKETGLLYRFEEFEELAEHISYIFTNSSKALSIAKKGREAALKRHDKTTITNDLLKIYKSI